MGGCTNCGGKVGCDDRKGSMLGEVDRTLARLYPTRTWGEPVDGDVPAGLWPDELDGLADELASRLNAATFVQPGGDDEPCDFIHVLCMGRVPCIVQVRDHGVPVPDEWHTTDGVSELYLRVVISQRARLAAVQQVAIDLVRADGGWLVRERPRAGVYDAPLLHRMQKLVSVLPGYDLLHLDFGEISHPPPDYAPGVWTSLYGAAPSIANYLFFPQPPTMESTAFLPAGAAR